MATLKSGAALARVPGNELFAIRDLCSTVAGEHHPDRVPLQSASPRGLHMTSLPQTRQRTIPAQDGRRTSRETSPAREAPSPARARQALPAVDPSTVFGCVDWFLYPDATAEAQAERA